MNCLIDFLTDSKQKSLINMVQNREETFEYALDSYRRLFLVEMEYCMGKKSRDFEADSPGDVGGTKKKQPELYIKQKSGS